MLLDLGIKAESISRLFLKEVSWQLRKHNIKDLSAVQAVILLKIAKQKLSVGELESRGIYLGSNPSYNLKALIDNGYIEQAPGVSDLRVKIINATKKGLDVYEKIHPLFDINTPVTQDYYAWLCGTERFFEKWEMSINDED